MKLVFLRQMNSRVIGSGVEDIMSHAQHFTMAARGHRGTPGFGAGATAGRIPDHRMQQMMMAAGSREMLALCPDWLVAIPDFQIRESVP